MVECNFIEDDSIEAPNAYPNDQQQHFRLNKVNEVKVYFIA